MTRRETIKSFVLRRAAEDASDEDIQREARERFPLRCVGLTYIANIRRRSRKGEDQWESTRECSSACADAKTG